MKKIGITATVAVLVILLAAFALTGCNEKMTVEEGREVLSDSIEKALASDVYYIKYRINDKSSDEGRYVQYSLNAQGKTAKFTVANGSLLKTTYEDTYFGKSLKANASSAQKCLWNINVDSARNALTTGTTPWMPSS